MIGLNHCSHVHEILFTKIIFCFSMFFLHQLPTHGNIVKTRYKTWSVWKCSTNHIPSSFKKFYFLFYLKLIFFSVLDCFEMLKSKIILKNKIKKYHFDAFSNEKHFEK